MYQVSYARKSDLYSISIYLVYDAATGVFGDEENTKFTFIQVLRVTVSRKICLRTKTMATIADRYRNVVVVSPTFWVESNENSEANIKTLYL